MNIAIIGAGFTGLTAAYELLKKGYTVTIFEKASQPGGLALGFKKDNWQWTLEEYYHHWFTNDHAVLNLAKELEYKVVTIRPKTSSYIDNQMYQLDSPLTFLTFPKLSLWERLRMISVLAFLRYDPFWQPLETVRAGDILPKAMGEKAYNILWNPLLQNKFGKYANTISLAWFWARIKKRTPSLAYPEGGFLQFAQTFAKKIEHMGGKFLYNADIKQLEEKNNKTVLTYQRPKMNNQKLSFDKAIVTLPSFAFLKICPQLPDAYKKQLHSLQGIGAITVVLRLKKPFFSDGTYWLNICDTKAPVLAIVEHTNFMDKKHYDNEHLVYLGNYLPKDHPYFSMNGKELLQTFDPLLKKINPQYAKTLIGIDVFQVPFAQPIIPTQYSKMIPPFETPLQHVYLANMQQVYPWDRGTNYAVELGQKIAGIVDRQ
jgi:protoporphyrinogen oxidase